MTYGNTTCEEANLILLQKSISAYKLDYYTYQITYLVQETPCVDCNLYNFGFFQLKMYFKRLLR